MDVIKVNTDLSLTAINKNSSEHKINCFNKFLELTAKRTAENGINENFDIELVTDKIVDTESMIKGLNTNSKSVVLIWGDTLTRMDKDPSLKAKIIAKIEEFTSIEEQSKVDALQPPVKSAGMIIYPNGDALYWLEAYSDENNMNDDKKEISTNNSVNQLLTQYIDNYIDWNYLIKSNPFF